ncbi:MAG: PEGA domain-containing protein [Deltaproteobacteria bacterium]|nr:PEGA domain-containing protein [Deltaproteobacteria bacterium]
MLRQILVWMTLFAVMFAGLTDAEARKRRKRRSVKVPVILLPVKVKGLSREQAVSLAKLLGKTMFNELREIGVFKVLKAKKTLRKLKKKKVYTSSCYKERKCLRKVGRAVRAKVIYHMHLQKQDDGVMVTLRTFDVKSGKELRKATSVTSGEGAEVEREARWMARKVSGPMITTVLRKKGKGKFKVVGDEGDAELIVNGKSYGKRMNKSFKVSPGVFDVVVRKEGFEDFHDVIVVRPKQERVITAVFTQVDRSDKPVVGLVDKSAGDAQPKPKAELPAWAKFGPAKTEKDKPKTKPLIAKPKVVAKQDSKAEKPFLPKTKTKVEPEEKTDDEGGGFYTTWWFWTAVGVGVVGAATAVTVVSLGGETVSDTGGAILQWQ